MDIEKRSMLPVKAIDKLEEAWQKAAPGLSKKPVKEQIHTVAHDKNFQRVAGGSAGAAALTTVAFHGRDRVEERKEDAVAKFDAAVEKGLASTLSRAADHIEALTPHVQRVGASAQSWRDGIHGLADHPAKKEVTRLLDATAKLTNGKKYKPAPVAKAKGTKGWSLESELASRDQSRRSEYEDRKAGRLESWDSNEPLKASPPRERGWAFNKETGRGIKATGLVRKFDEAVEKGVSTKLRASSQLQQDQGQMMQQAMQEATNALAPKVAMEVERIRQERMMQMMNDQQALQQAPSLSGPSGPSGPAPYTSGPAMTGAQQQGPKQYSAVSAGPQTYA